MQMGVGSQIWSSQDTRYIIYSNIQDNDSMQMRHSGFGGEAHFTPDKTHFCNFIHWFTKYNIYTSDLQYWLPDDDKHVITYRLLILKDFHS